MSEEAKKTETPQEKPKENGEFKWVNAPKAISEALKKMKEAKGFSKVLVFFETFWNEMRGVEEKKKEVTAEAKAEAARTIGDKMKAANEATKLDEKTSQPDKDFYQEILAMGVTAGNELPLEMQDAFKSGRGNLETAVKGETPEDSTLDEVKAMAGAGLLTITKLKAKYPDEAKFKEALDKLDKISDSSAYPLKKLLSMPVLKIFKLKIDKTEEGLKSVGNMLGMSEKGEGMKLLDSFQMTTGDAERLKGLNEQPIKDEAEIVAIMKKSIFPNTEEVKITKVARIISKLLVEKPDHVDAQTVTDLVFNIDDRDMKRLIEILTGKKETQVAKAA